MDKMKNYRLLFFFIIAIVGMRTTANSQDRRILTMEEAVLGENLKVENIKCHWMDSGAEYRYTDNGSLITVEAKSGRILSTTDADDNTKAKEEERLHVYSKDGNIFYKQNGEEYSITSYTDPGIVCGEVVSRNEFGIDRGIFLSPDSSKVAFYKKDESRVTLFPLLDITTRTGSLKEIRYPMNGMDSEIISLGVYDFKSRETTWIQVTDFDEERYLTNITWGPDNATIYIQVLNREQKEMHLNCYSATNGTLIRRLFTDSDTRYIEPQYPLYFLGNNPNQFIYATNVRDGYWSLYLHNTDGKLIKRITPIDADVEYLTQHNNYIYYYSAQVSPIERHLFRSNIKSGRIEQITAHPGWHKCQLSPNGEYVIDEFSAHNIPLQVDIVASNGKNRKNIFLADDPTTGLNFCDIEHGTIKSADGKYDNHYRLIKPIDFDPNKRYPTILYVYGGPHNQLVTNSFQYQLRRWEMYMAQHGYVLFVMDNRGTPNRGEDYEKTIHRQCGKVEMEDQMEGMRWLMSHPWVDSERIGVHGWSYGGYMTISLMVNHPEIFKVGVAGGPVIDWRWYEVMYGERYMENEESNPEGFASTSLIGRAADLKGRLLICQGAIDDVVLWQHSLSFIEACIKNGVQVDYFPYPTHKHNVVGKDRVHLMNKVTNYFDDYLSR